MTHDKAHDGAHLDAAAPDTTGPDTTGPGLTRRGMLAAGTLIGASAALAAAGCTTYRPDTGSADGSGDGRAPVSAPASGSASAGPGAGAAGGAAALGATSEIPVGGGTVFKAQKVVVTQPAAGTFKAFSSVCTHQGCQVSEVAGGTINCDCHGSKFSAADGSVTEGPAKRPLAAKQVSTAGGQIKLA